MKASELINELQALVNAGFDFEVMCSSDYGDRCHTEQLVNIEEVATCVPMESGYSYSGLKYPHQRNSHRNDDEPHTEPAQPEVIVLRYTRD